VRAVVGRASELAAVAAFLDARPDRPAALVLAGDAGIGKTTIVRSALQHASEQGLRVFSARPAAGEMELPYVGLGDLLATVREESLASLAAPQRAAIEGALARGAARVEEHALSRGVLELLRLEGAQGDLVLAVDDVQWLDRPTASALGFALRRLGLVPIRVLAADRATDAPGAALGLADWEDVRRVAVAPLSATELGALIREHLGRQLARPGLEELHRASGGNPMYALELVRQGPAAGSSLTRALQERLHGLEPGVWEALSFAAAALRPSVDLLLGAGIEAAELRAALAEGLLEADGERLSFAHPLLGAAAYELLLPDERRRIHSRLAAVSRDAVECGHHVSRSAAGRDEAAALQLDRAAAEAAALGDHSGAAAFLLRAAELSDEPSGSVAQARSALAAGELELAGDVAAAAALARELVDHFPPGVPRARARQTLFSASAGSDMSYGDGLGQHLLALEDAASDAGVQAELHLAMAEIYCGMCRLEEGVGHARKAIELAERVEATPVAVAGLAMLGFAESMLGLGVTAAARAAVELWDGEVGRWAPPRLELACAYLGTTEFDRAAGLLEQDIAMAQDRGLEALEVIARAHLAEAQLRAGRWDEALANARLAFEHARQATDAQVATGAAYALAMTHASLGDHEAARALAAGALPAADATRDFWARTLLRAVLGHVALAEDDPAEAVAVLEPAWTLMCESGLGDLSLFPVAQVLGEALVAVRRLDDALAVAAVLRGSPVGEQPWSRAMAGRCEALVDSARGEHTAAQAAIAGALEAHGDLPEPFELARTLLAGARVERNARNWGAARALLVDARDRFERLGAARWAEKAAADLSRLPGRRPSSRDELSTREREIAGLVAEGLANKEIAARLFLSRRTVEANLSKVYAKLGVRSRTELAGLLNRPGGR
jgi:DNA-binding CsgD family transcriptional regulator